MLGPVRLFDVATALALASDAGNGQPYGTAMRITARALRYAAAGAGAAAPQTIVWAGLLRFSGCVATSPEEASFGGDDLALRSALLGTDLTDPADAGFHLGSGRFVPAGAGPIDVPDFARRGPALAPGVLSAHCEVAVAFGRRLGVEGEVLSALAAYHDRFDGLGPLGLRGEAIPLVCRLLSVAQGVEVHAALTADERRDLLRARAGRMYDPAVVELALRVDAEPLAGVDEALRRAEGAPHTVPAAEVPTLLQALGDWADLKSPWFHGHSRVVARTVTALARSEGEDVALLAAAASVHDLGRAAVPNGIWEKPGPLDSLERERMRTHALHTVEILRRGLPGVPALSRLAAADHERVDGTGYPVGLDAPALTRAARLLAAADVWAALREPRPHRPALARDAAAAVLRAEVAAGHLDARAVAATLDCAGLDGPTVRLPDGLSAREVEVLGFVARGLTNKEVGDRLGVSPRTVQQHTLNIYRKIGVQTRAAAALYAVEHDLVA